MGVINMAHGEFMMVGAYVTYLMQGVFAATPGGTAAGWHFLLSLPAAFLASAVLSYALEAAIIRHLYGRALDTLLATWGVSVILQQVARDIFGAPNVQVASPAWLAGGLPLFGVVLSYRRLFIIGLVALVV